MKNIRDPRQRRLIDPFDGVISEAGRKRMATGWQGVMRHFVLHRLPALKLGADLDDTMGRPSTELFSICGLLLVREFQNWTVPETLDAVLFRSDVQYALNLEPGVEISQRTIERYIERLQKDEELTVEMMTTVTDELVKHLELTVSKQRLDSTHIVSDMAVFGRTRMMGVAVKRFLTRVRQHHESDFAEVPEVIRKRYQPSVGSLFADVKTTEQRAKTRQQAAEDLHAVIEHFADHPQIVSWPSYQKLLLIFEQQCEVEADSIVVKTSPGGDVMLNPSDSDATYCRHKGAGYQVQLAETCNESNEVELILAAKVETASEPDAGAVEPILDELESRNHRPDTMLADCSYGSDENVEKSRERGVGLVSPVPGGKKHDPNEITAAHFTIDPEDHSVTKCPAGHTPQSSSYNKSSDRMTVIMSSDVCSACAQQSDCPVRLKTGPKVKKPSARVYFTMKEHRSCSRREAEQDPEFHDRYRLRSGIEGTNSAIKRKCGLERLRVRGFPAVRAAVLLKIAGWNILRAACSSKLRRVLAARMWEGRFAPFFRGKSRLLSVVQIACSASISIHQPKSDPNHQTPLEIVAA